MAVSLFVVPPMVAGNANAICHWTCFRTALSHTLPLLPYLAYAVDTRLIRWGAFSEKANFVHRPKNFFWPKLFFGTNSSIPILWLSSEKWIEGLLLRNIDLFFQGHFQCFGEKANFDHLDKFAFLDSSCRKKYFFVA